LAPQASTEPPPCKEMLPITSENLTGTWVSVDAPAAETTRYYEDGSFSGRVEDHGKIIWLYSGNWKLDGHTMNTAYTFSSLDRVPVGTTDSDEILGIGCGMIRFRNKSGIVGQYRLTR